MTEELLFFLWKHRLYLPESLMLPDGSKIEVIHPGEHNRDAGPDFFNTRIKLGNTIWAGNAEVHVKASDWSRHGHDSNTSFQNIILHIVAQNDLDIKDSNGQIIPVITIRCDEAILAQYQYLLQNKLWVPCAKHLQTIDPFTISLWLEKLGIERLEEKAHDITLHLEQTKNDWEEVLYRMLARSFGFHLNGQPFELLAKSLPYKILEKHSSSLLHTEALIFGQAGFLNDPISYDDYYLKLQKEYQYLAKMHQLKPLPNHLWKFLRLRPGNFPTIRMGQFASVIHNHSKLFASVRDVSSVSDLESMFDVTTSSYWNNHYIFGKVSKPKEKTMGSDSIDIILINAIIPVLFMYGKKLGLDHAQNKALDFICELSPEKNSITDNWQKLGIKAQSAYQSQALLHLKNKFCNGQLCLDCSIGNRVLINAARKD